MFEFLQILEIEIFLMSHLLQNLEILKKKKRKKQTNSE